MPIVQVFEHAALTTTVFPFSCRVNTEYLVLHQFYHAHKVLNNALISNLLQKVEKVVITQCRLFHGAGVVQLLTDEDYL